VHFARKLLVIVIWQNFKRNCIRGSTNGSKMCFSAGVRIQRSHSATYPARISTTFETTDMNRCLWWLAWKISKFLCREIGKPKKRNFGGLRWCAYTHSTNITISGKGSHFKASQHPNDVPSVSWVLMGTHDLGAMTHTRRWKFDNFIPVDDDRHTVCDSLLDW